MKIALDIGVIVFSLIAAVLWFLSSYKSFPAMRPYWDHIPPDDPFFVAVGRSAFLNCWAAGFSGLSALCAAIQLMI
jgi:hypothetical protein